MHSLVDPFSLANRNIGIGGGNHHIRAAYGLLRGSEVLNVHIFVDRPDSLNETFRFSSLRLNTCTVFMDRTKRMDSMAALCLPAGTDQRHAAGIFSCHITRRDGIVA
jgi:hypothetical protein